jgi:hypothetical protein
LQIRTKKLFSFSELARGLAAPANEQKFLLLFSKRSLPTFSCAPHHFVLEPERFSRYLPIAAVQQRGENTWLT